MRRILNVIWIAFFLCMAGRTWANAVLSGLVIEKQSNDAFDLIYSGEQLDRPNAFLLMNPTRLVLDFKTARWIGRLPLTSSSGLIHQVRVGHPASGVTRFVFELKQRVVIHWVEKTEHKGRCHIQPLSKKEARVRSVPARHGYRDIIIVLDPGHGGHDPGALGPQGSQEKQVTLSIARVLKNKIDQNPGMRAVLTRQGDQYVGLRERLKFARKQNPDVFISIHADAFIHAQSHGASVFALSERGATSEAARWLAEKENYSELGGVNLKQLEDRNGLIRTVLVDLSQTATIAGSLQLGRQVLERLGTITSLHNRRVEQARFVVLKSLDTPSILIETGFISNPAEASRLKDPRYQQQLAEAIFQGLNHYFWEHPPHGTRLESMAMLERSR